MYANGKWIKDNPIPAEESSWGIAYLVINENLQRLRDISEEAAKQGGQKAPRLKKLVTSGAPPWIVQKWSNRELNICKPYFDQINAINDVPSLINVISELNKIGVSALFSDYVVQDDKNSEVMAFRMDQGGLGLPEREYYFNTDSSTTNIRNAYLHPYRQTFGSARRRLSRRRQISHQHFKDGNRPGKSLAQACGLAGSLCELS